MALAEPMPIILLVLLFLLLFGSTQIPKLARSLGRAKGEFNLAKKEMELEASRVEGEGAKPKGADEAQVRQTARNLGIAESGLSLDEVKAAIKQKLA